MAQKLLIGRKVPLRLQNLVPRDGPLPPCPRCGSAMMVTGNQAKPWIVCLCGVRVPIQDSRISMGTPEEMVAASLDGMLGASPL